MEYGRRIIKMFLECNFTISYIIECILCFIETHSVLVGVITSVIVGSLWMRKFVRQKRAEAFFGFYSKLSLYLRELQTRLEDTGQLNVSDAEAGNIFSLIYLDSYIVNACPRYKKLSAKELDSYKGIAKKIKETLLSTDNNVYPKGSNRKKWHESQQVVFSFCEFLENEAYQHTTNQMFVGNTQEIKHITKCKTLVDAMMYIQEAIEKAKY